MLLWIASGPEPLAGWWVGGTFGLGQMLAALVLYWNLERPVRDSDGADYGNDEEEIGER